MFGSRHRRGPRIVLALYGLSGLPTLWKLITERSWLFMSNYLAYHRAAEAVLAGEDLYAVTHPEAADFHFLYPPIVALSWLPSTVMSPLVGYGLQTLISIGFGLVIAVVAWRLIEETGMALSSLDRGLLIWAAVGSSIALPSLFYGNINLVLTGLLAAALWYRHQDRPIVAGIAFGVPGLVKAFPALFGLWLLRSRDWRATLAWMLTGLAGVIIGLGLFGVGTTRQWLDEALFARASAIDFAQGLHPSAGYVSLRQPIALVLGTDGLIVSVFVILLVVPFVLVLLVNVDEILTELLALLGIIAGTLLLLPTYYVYLVYLLPAIFPLAYLIEPGRIRALFLVGMTLITTTLTPETFEPISDRIPLEVTDMIVGLMEVARPPLIGVILVVLAGIVVVGTREGWVDRASSL